MGYGDYMDLNQLFGLLKTMGSSLPTGNIIDEESAIILDSLTSLKPKDEPEEVEVIPELKKEDTIVKPDELKNNNLW